MDIQECIDFANENQVCYVATVEGDQPRVRAIRLWFADDTGFYIQTQSVKAFAKQMENNNKIEICFFSPKVDRMMRASGKVEPVTDMAIRTRCLEEKPFLKKMGVEKPEDPLLAIFRLYTGEAYFWSMEYSMRESEIERVKF
ncbi:MAG TPA: pyridoxamine 5'-phosphate oxidase [Dehalococcoidia bacterium]|nr:pyridoxamine 5'-phosphate oxidase [Dehalococcoidia bacterium]